MEALFDSLKVVKLWQVAVLAALLVGAAGGTYGGYVLVTRSGGDGLGENQQLIPVQRGNLVNEVSTNGSLVFPNRELLTFGTQGTLGEVMVEEGDRVGTGQELAKLDAATVASLEKAAAQARVDLQRAEDALENARNPHTPLDIAQAESKVAAARTSLQDARDRLDGLLDPTSQQIAQAESKAANAELSLQNALDALGRLLTPTAQEMAQAETAVTNAKLSLQNALDALNGLLTPPVQELAQAETAVTNAKLSVENTGEALKTLKDGATAEDLAEAQAQVDSATTSLANSSGDLSLVYKEWDKKLETAQVAVDTSTESYLGAYQKWLGIGAEKIEEPLDPDTLLANWGVDLDSLFDPDSSFQDTKSGFLSAGPPPEDPDTPWNEFVVYAWMNLFGGVVPTCDDIVLAAETMCVKKEMDDGWDALQSAMDNLETVQTQSAKAISNSQAAVTRNEDSVAAAKEALAELKIGPDPLEIQSKENQLTLAAATLTKAEEDLAGLKSVADPLEIQSKENQLALARATLAEEEEDLAELKTMTDETKGTVQAAIDSIGQDAAEVASRANILEVEAQRKQVAVAQANLDEANEALKELMGEPDALQLDAQLKQVAVAQASLDSAGEDLAELKSSVDTLEVALRESDVASARLALDAATERVEGAVMRAPMDGIVSTVNVEAGQTVNPNTPIVEIVDPTVVEVDGIVDEIDVLFVREGATAQVTMDALPGEVLAGTVSSLDSAPRNQQGVVTYPIRIQIEVPEGVELREGLTAVASIVLRQDNNVLLVPNQALYGTFQEPLVRVMKDGEIEARAVVLGNSDDFWVAVVSGLEEGDRVVMETAEVATDPFAQIRQRIQGGGGGQGGFGGAGGLGGGGGGGRRPGN